MPDHVEFHGVLPALVTPFTDDGAGIDADSLTAIVERLIRGGVAGLVPGGSTGEFTTLTNAERRELIELTVAAAAGRVPVVAGTGALSTRDTVELSVHAERSGAAVVMIVPPFYDPLTWSELLAHYSAVAERIAIPIMYYNLPSASGVTLDAGQLRELQRVAGVTSLKDTGGDAVAATELIQSGDHGPTLLNGWDTADLRRARRRRARRRVGNGLDPYRAMRRTPPSAHRRHRSPRRPRAVDEPLAAL
jgi:dihydrodipicolinate synthase/N-acetylneuraminate lyase